MKATGIVRNIDELGRLVLPKEFRKHLEIGNETPVEITSEDDKIIIRRFNPRCIFCNAEGELTEFKGKRICRLCLAELK